MRKRLGIRLTMLAIADYIMTIRIGVEDVTVAEIEQGV